MSAVIQDLMQIDEIDQSLETFFAKGEQPADDSKMMSESELVTIIGQELSTTYGDDNSELSRDRAAALDYFFNRPRGDEVRGNSQVQSSDVMDVVEWMMPDLIEAFTTNDEAVLFEPVSEEDIIYAKQETAYINHIFYKESNGYLMLYEFFKDALLQKNGIGKAYRVDGFKVKYTEYTGITEVELEMIQRGQDGIEIEVIDIDETVKLLKDMPEEEQSQARMLPEVQKQVEEIMKMAQEFAKEAMDEMGMNPYVTSPQVLQRVNQELMGESSKEALEEITATFYDIKIKMYIEDKRTAVETVPPEEYRINEDHDSVNVDDARFQCHEHAYSRTELIEMGYDQETVMDLNHYNFPINEEQFSRKYHTIDREYNPTMDPTMVRVLVQDCYMRVDYDGDGVAELRHVVISGSTILENEYCDEVPFVCISPFMVPHRWVGVSIFDRIKQIQDIATATWRQLMDNMYKMNNARTLAVENRVNMDDLLSSRAGGVVRVKSIDSVSAFPHQPIGVEAYQLLQRLSIVRMERSGVGPEMMAEGMVIDNDTAHGVERLMAAKEKLQGIIIRNFAETGVAKLFLKMHNLEVKHQNKAKQVRVNGQWTEMRPWEWGNRTGTTIKVGLGAGDSSKHAATLQSIIASQNALSQLGLDGILVDNDSKYRANIDLAKFQGLPLPEQYFVNPSSPQAKQALQAKMEAAQKPSTEDKILMLTAKIEEMDAKLRSTKQEQTHVKDIDEQHRKWAKDEDESERGWTQLEIDAEEDLGPEGRAE